MKALIEANGRIAEVRADTFPVAAPLLWQDVPESTTTVDTWGGAQVIKYVPPPPPTVAELAAAKRGEIHNRAAAERSLIAPNYPQHEIDTWDQQLREATVYTADAQAPVPLLSAMAAARGWTVQQLAARVMQKAAEFAVSGGEVLGTQQALEDSLEAILADHAAGTIIEAEARIRVAAIVWPEGG
ncbi:hypothetical protein [Algihabitans sp.]|uniref:hypothetical protein n=1 Tax=Algihabitans sp. TaxID=2821514 RepID=UPI003BA92CA9